MTEITLFGSKCRSFGGCWVAFKLVAVLEQSCTKSQQTIALLVFVLCA